MALLKCAPIFLSFPLNLIDGLNMTNLDEMKIGQTGRVTGFSKLEDGRAYRRKLLAMGLTVGTEFSVMRVAPMGDPIEIQVRGFSLSLRKIEAATLQVELSTN